MSVDIPLQYATAGWTIWKQLRPTRTRLLLLLLHQRIVIRRKRRIPTLSVNLTNAPWKESASIKTSSTKPRFLKPHLPRRDFFSSIHKRHKNWLCIRREIQESSMIIQMRTLQKCFRNNETWMEYQRYYLLVPTGYFCFLLWLLRRTP